MGSAIHKSWDAVPGFDMSGAPLTLNTCSELLKRSSVQPLESEKEKGQAGARPGLWANPPELNCRMPDLFSFRRRWWGHHLPVLRTSPESQSAGHYDRDHDHFQ